MESRDRRFADSRIPQYFVHIPRVVTAREETRRFSRTELLEKIVKDFFVRNAFAFVEFGDSGFDIASGLHPFNEFIPVFDIADERGWAAVLRDEDEAVRLRRTLQTRGKIVAAFGKGNDVLGKARRRKCGAAAVAD